MIVDKEHEVRQVWEIDAEGKEKIRQAKAATEEMARAFLERQAEKPLVMKDSILNEIFTLHKNAIGPDRDYYGTLGFLENPIAAKVPRVQVIDMEALQAKVEASDAVHAEASAALAVEIEKLVADKSEAEEAIRQSHANEARRREEIIATVLKDPVKTKSLRESVEVEGFARSALQRRVDELDQRRREKVSERDDVQAQAFADASAVWEAERQRLTTEIYAGISLLYQLREAYATVQWRP